MMARRRMSQATLAERANIAPSTLSRRLLGGADDFTIGELGRIAAVLDIDVTALIVGGASE